jgi:di/tricarboxylate transporter
VFDVIPVQVSFSIAAVLMIITGILPVKELYSSIDWPVIVLLGAMIPAGVAFETTGGADLIASQILVLGNELPVWFLVGLVMLITMFLSDLINNAATVVLMAPIGITIAGGLGISPDPMLMAIAIGASCAFLTPIGHQSNALVMGPGGYKFSDYWRMGLPLEIIILVLGTPLILIFWPA